MEGRQHTGSWKNIYLPCILFLLAVLRHCDATNDLNNTKSCLENEYLHNGVCCDKCPPGFKLTQKCSGEGLRSTCEKCGPETFQDHMNYFPNCFLCRKVCDPESHEIEKGTCTNVQNRICDCKEGYYKIIVDENTMYCKRCQKCGDGEIVSSPCDKKDTVCECKPYHERVAVRTCLPCTNCSSNCPHLCPLALTSKPPRPDDPFQTSIFTWICLSALIGMICIIILRHGFKYLKKRKQTQSLVSHDPEKQAGMKETHECVQSKEDESKLLAPQPDTALPDVLPREIKTHEFIYFVLDNVPVSRFKEIVRRLNVSEQEIGRAERDNRAFADAQYQMLMAWVENGVNGGKSILPRPLLQEFVNRLKEMNLTACAESIEDRYT
ncbi:tumor necrosis factor receptor superfamily member 1A [Clarias gariepinus]|uniref:tumor necrosis factor receptor superfamily member 1A n=1 Tax=Clarias gariepinus TaxID=13013 RepID=UPI00234C87BE|nr:tumor necrosis factor receptor superfamily member 1A [Clarias gariepinus]XP_053349653.1 tumor necrosis factor receptor superfamily member 1A [Clarias gariepinus]XP_053349654.1 tumor necrosis factor receptor superfamily member 1A [Clarias gariepinus]XP_053349655.1 tumor necrosis factor receptor superfamily member 1A [Clarias gariepinus]